MSLLIRSAVLSDKSSWASMRHKLWPHAGMAELAREIPAMLKQRRFRAWIAELDGKPAGFAEAFLRDFANGCLGQPVVFLEGIWVAPRLRRKGVGRALIKAVEAWAKTKGLKEIGSDAYLRDERSHASHRGWGFKETERVVYFRKKI